MGKRERKPPSKPSNAYLISFGDTMTAMLAFFIVLNTLSKEQTGANLHSGTGSFVATLNSMGLPGSFSGDKSKRTVQQVEAAPKYMVTDGETSDDRSGTGPDENDNDIRVLDRELEQVQRMLNEIENQFAVEREKTTSTAIEFDFFDPLGQPGQILPRSARKTIGRSLGALLQPGYRMDVKLWAPTPSPSAIKRISNLAFELNKELRTSFPVLARLKKPVRATVNLWPYSDRRRPVLSVVIVKDTEDTE